MIIMRMYALYERSRKVLAFYLVLAVSFITMGGVSPNFSGSNQLDVRSCCV